MENSSQANVYKNRAHVGRLLTRVQSELATALDHALADFDVSAAQYVILSTLWYGRADTATQICKEISYNPGAMTRMLDRLEQKKLIVRLPMEDSRRAYKLELTAEGKAVFPDLLATSTSVMNRFFGSISDQELQQLEALLQRMAGTA